MMRPRGQEKAPPRDMKTGVPKKKEGTEGERRAGNGVLAERRGGAREGRGGLTT